MSMGLFARRSLARRAPRLRVFGLDGPNNTDFGLPEQPGRVARTTSPSLDATLMTWRSIAGILARVEGRRVVSGRLELLGES